MVSDRDPGQRTLVIGGTIVATIGIGWFVLSHVIMGTKATDAVVEALGVMLALTVVASVIGAVVSSVRANRPARDVDDSPAG